MAVYRKKSVEIEAVYLPSMFDENGRFKHDMAPLWLKKAICAWQVRIMDRQVSINTLEGVMTASETDYIIRGVKGEIYPCKEDIFLMTYELVRSGEANNSEDGEECCAGMASAE